MANIFHKSIITNRISKLTKTIYICRVRQKTRCLGVIIEQWSNSAVLEGLIWGAPTLLYFISNIRKVCKIQFGTDN